MAAVATWVADDGGGHDGRGDQGQECEDLLEDQLENDAASGRVFLSSPHGALSLSSSPLNKSLF